MEYEDIVRLQCFKDGKKLRVRIITPGYNSSANCLFPKAIRQEGKIYEVPSSAINFNRNLTNASYQQTSCKRYLNSSY